MSYKVPSLDDMTSLLVAFWRALFPLSNVGSRFSYHWKRLRAIALAVTDLHAHIDQVKRSVMPNTALGDDLLEWGQNVFGVEKKGATPARKSAALRVYGTAASPVAADLELTHAATGLRFQTNSAGSVGAGGSVDLDVIAIDTGSQTRLNAGEYLQFVATPAGCQAKALLVLNLDEDGFDEELDSAYQNRVLAKIADPPMGGTQADFEAWALEVDGVALAKAYPGRAGLGTVDVAAMHAGSGSVRELSSTERATVLAYLQTKAPVQIASTGGALRVLITVADLQDVEITVTPNGDAAWAFDWDDSTAPTVLAWTAATLTLQFTTARPATMLAGHRICLRGVASVQDGAPLVIAALTGTDSVVLKAAPSVAPAATDKAYSGGPLVDLIRPAIVAHMNGEKLYADSGKPTPASSIGNPTVILKPVLAEGIGPANPAGVYGTWSGSLVRNVLAKIAMYPTGARNVNVVTPAADHDATDDVYPNDGQIHYISPRLVLIRKG